jgi:hypothetical protein
METAKVMDAHMTCEVCGNVGHASKQGKKPASSTMTRTMGSATTNIGIKGGTRGPTSRSTIKMEVTILSLSIMNLPLKILPLAKIKLMKV